MDAAEVRRRRAEAEARLKSDLRAHERSLGDYREFMRDLREQCQHTNQRSDVDLYATERYCTDCGGIVSTS